jgi:hypothetical protein
MLAGLEHPLVARQLIGLEPEPMFRAVILYKYSGVHKLPLLTYTDQEGEDHEYHSVVVYGPFEKPHPAQQAVKRDVGYAKKGYRNHYDFSMPYGPARDATKCEVSEIIGLVEIATPLWDAFSKPNTDLN